jgi:hypothetical protein
LLLGCGPVNHAPAHAPGSRATKAAPAVHDTAVIDDKAPVIDDKAPVIDDKAPVIDDKALLWVLHAAEYRAVAYTVFAAAAGVLAELLKDRTWSAALEQSTEVAAGKPPAVIVDVDDTLLSTSAYQWRRVLHHQSQLPASRRVR